MRSRSALLLAIALVLSSLPAQGAVFVVTSADVAGDAIAGDGTCETSPGNRECTALAAVEEANAWPEVDTIALPAGSFGSWIFSELTGTATVVGDGAANTLLVGDGVDTALQLDQMVDVTLIGVTVTGGHGMNVGGGIRLYDNGRLTLIDCVIRDNHANNVGGGLYIGSGRLTMIGTTVVGNIAGNVGAGVHVSEGAAADISNSTISGNHAGNTGGGVSNEGRTTLNAVTVANNTAANVGAGVDNDFDSAPVLRITNSLLAGNRIENIVNSRPEDCRGEVSSGGFNVIQQADCWLVSDDIQTEYAGVDPLIGPLADNGGPTPTHAIDPASVAVNWGNPAVPTGRGGACPATDQRGVDRPAGIRCDSGAYELSRCGNGVVDPEEECDDGSLVDGDGCDSNCTVTRCGNGVTTEGEACDDANLADGDCCASDCTLPSMESTVGSDDAEASFTMRRGGKLSLKWQSRAALPRSVFGDPTEDTDVSLCIVDTAGASPTLVASLEVKAGQGWRSSTTSFDYRGATAAPGTLGKVRLQASGGLRILAKGLAPHLRMGRLLLAPVSVALRTSDGEVFPVGFGSGTTSDVNGFSARKR